MWNLQSTVRHNTQSKIPPMSSRERRLFQRPYSCLFVSGKEWSLNSSKALETFVLWSLKITKTFLLSCKLSPTLCSRFLIPILYLFILNYISFDPPAPEDPFEFWPCSPICLYARQHDTTLTSDKHYLCCTYEAIKDKSLPIAPSHFMQSSKECSVNKFFHETVTEIPGVLHGFGVHSCLMSIMWRNMENLCQVRI